MTLRNWSENIRFESAAVHAPRTVEALQEIVRASRKVRVLGARHSFNDAAAIDGQVDVDGTQEVTGGPFVGLHFVGKPGRAS